MNKLKALIDRLKTIKKSVLLAFSVIVFLIFNELLVLLITYNMFGELTAFPVEKNLLINSLTIILGPIYYFVVIFIDVVTTLPVLAGVIAFVPVIVCLSLVVVMFFIYKAILKESRNIAFVFLLSCILMWILGGSLMYVILSVSYFLSPF